MDCYLIEGVPLVGSKREVQVAVGFLVERRIVGAIYLVIELFLMHSA